MERLLEACQRALNTLKVINAITPNPQIEGAIKELEFAIGETAQSTPRGAGDVDKLIQAVYGLVEYRAAAGPLNFQLEKADYFIRTLFRVLQSMGEADGIRKAW